ncbi:uncharacterized protein LOC143355481 [Halictus rubicundus]|uniref:uncharacterized protein LOC143355481 n=1 Tax=Halictus rubicundus TaxID=77578 RepID=UPI0040367541
MTDFAKAQLLKYGWTEGKGLGKNESGITDALKPKLKFDSAGIGHKEDWNEWWATSFNNAANNIMVEPQSQGVTISVSKEYENKLPKHLSRNKFSYGNFLKTSTLLNGTLVQEHDSNVPKIEKNKQDVKPVFLTDDELFKVCGGRTAHKGARHGLKLNGKLKRIEEQERNFLQMHNIKSESDPCDTDEETLPINLSTEEEGVSKKSRCSIKRKRRINHLSHQLNSLCNINDAVEKSKPKKKKRKKGKDGPGNHKSDGIGKEEGDKEIGDMPLPVGENLDNWAIKTKNRKQIEDCDYECSHKKRKKNKRRKDKEYQNGNLDLEEGETVQHQSQEHSIDGLDAAHHRELPPNDSLLNSSNDVESFPCPDSPDTYTRNESNRLNYKILKKKKAKHLMKQKKMVQNVIEDFEIVHVNAKDASERIDTKRKLNSIIEQMVDINIAIDKSETMKKSSKQMEEDNKRKDKGVRKKGKHCKKKDKGIRKKEKCSRKKRKKNK